MAKCMTVLAEVLKLLLSAAFVLQNSIPYLSGVCTKTSCVLDAGVSPALVDTIVKKITPHMPASAPAVKPSQVMQQALVHLNLAAAKLLSSFLPASLAHAEEQEEGWRASLLDYYVGIMEAGQVLPSRWVLVSSFIPV